MKRLSVFFITCLLFPVLIQAQGVGYLQINCEPDVTIYLNEEFKGISNSDFNGLIIQDITPGLYELRAVKQGFNEVLREVEINDGVVSVISLESFIPTLRISQEGDAEREEIVIKTGNLTVQSLPVEMQFNVGELGINEIKRLDKLNIKGIPVGEYPASFTFNDKTIEYNITVKPGQNNTVFANMLSTTVTETYRSILEDFDNYPTRDSGIGCKIKLLDNDDMGNLGILNYSFGLFTVDIERNSICDYMPIQKGDIIVAYNGSVRNNHESIWEIVLDLVKAYRNSNLVSLKVIRDASLITLNLESQERIQALQRGEGKLNLVVEPSNARIVISDQRNNVVKRLGGSQSDIKLSMGRYNLTVSKYGYFNHSQSIYIGRDSDIIQTIQLKKIAEEAPQQLSTAEVEVQDSAPVVIIRDEPVSISRITHDIDFEYYSRTLLSGPKPNISMSNILEFTFDIVIRPNGKLQSVSRDPTIEERKLQDEIAGKLLQWKFSAIPSNLEQVDHKATVTFKLHMN